MKSNDSKNIPDFRIRADLGRRDFLRYTLGSFAVVSTGAMTFGCGGGEDSLDSTPSTQTLRIGAVLPLTGTWKSIGLDMQTSMQLALPMINQYLSPWNKALELTIKDSASTPQQALSALKELEAAGIAAAIGPISSAEAPDMLAYANAHDLLLVSPSSSAVSLALPDQLVRLTPNDKAQVDALAIRFDAQAVETVLPVYISDLYGHDFHQSLVQRAATAKFTLLTGLEFAASGADYTVLVTEAASRLEAAGAGNAALLLVGRDTDAVALLRSASARNLLRNVAWYGAESVTRAPAVLADPVAREFATAVGLQGFTLAVEDTIPVVPLMMATGLLSAASGTQSSPSALAGWDALWLLAETLRQTPTGNTALLDKFKAVVNNGTNFLAQRTTLDANADLKAAKYARFAVRDDAALLPHWRLEGMYIRNAAGTQGFLTDATAYLTRAGGSVTIGALLPLTGSNASSGLAAQKALHLALEHAQGYFEAGQKLGLKFTLDVRDTASNPATALTQLNALQAAGVVLVIGPLYSNELEAIADYAKSNQLMLISPTSSAPSLGRSDDLIMRLSPDDTLQAKALTRLMKAQGKSALTVLHRNDSYGRELAQSVQSQFAGTAVLLPYATNTSDFRPLLAQAAQDLSSASTQALLVIGLGEVVTLLEQVPAGPLTTVAWYGTDGISRSGELLASAKAVATALKVRLTCSVYDEKAAGFFNPSHELVSTQLGLRLGTAATMSEFASYDALWLGATAYAMSSAKANSQTLWTTLNNPYGATGVGAGHYVFNKNQDQSLSLFGFYTVTSPAGTPLWQISAFYRNILTLSDDLLILPA